MTPTQRADRPASVTHAGLCLSVAAAVAVGGVSLPAVDLPIGIALACVLALVIVPIAAGDLLLFKVYRRESAGLCLASQPLNRTDFRRVAEKCLGFYGTLCVAAAMYWVFPLYEREYYQPFFALIETCLPPLVGVAPFYIWWLDRRMACPRDGTWQAGRLLLGQVRGLDRGELATYALGWLIKAFSCR